jgi:hypothetical protein
VYECVCVHSGQRSSVQGCGVSRVAVGVGVLAPLRGIGRRSTPRPASCTAAWSKRYDPLLRHGVEGAGGLGSLGYQTGTSEPPPAEHGPATCPEWLSSKQAEGAAKV